MYKAVLIILSMSFAISSKAQVKSSADNSQNLRRVAQCLSAQKRYGIFDTKSGPLEPQKPYVVFETDLSKPTSFPETTQGFYVPEAGQIALPPYWPNQSIPLKDCLTSPRLQIFISDEMIREFFVKAYFIRGEPRPGQNIEDMIKNGEAIPLKLRILCKSYELSDDPSVCHEIKLLDDIIPI